MNTISGDDNMSILAVSCNQAIVLTQKQGENILNQIKNNKSSKETNEQIIRQAKELRKKPSDR